MHHVIELRDTDTATPIDHRVVDQNYSPSNARQEARAVFERLYDLTGTEIIRSGLTEDIDDPDKYIEPPETTRDIPL